MWRDKEGKGVKCHSEEEKGALSKWFLKTSPGTSNRKLCLLKLSNCSAAFLDRELWGTYWRKLHKFTSTNFLQINLEAKQLLSWIRMFSGSFSQTSGDRTLSIQMNVVLDGKPKTNSVMHTGSNTEQLKLFTLP